MISVRPCRRSGEHADGPASSRCQFSRWQPNSALNGIRISRMSKVEWFRRTTWTAADAADFAAHLKRSRSDFHKAQYLRIQAGHLHAVGVPELTAVALGLLGQLVTDWPSESQLSIARPVGRGDDTGVHRGPPWRRDGRRSVGRAQRLRLRENLRRHFHCTRASVSCSRSIPKCTLGCECLQETIAAKPRNGALNSPRRLWMAPAAPAGCRPGAR